MLPWCVRFGRLDVNYTVTQEGNTSGHRKTPRARRFLSRASAVPLFLSKGPSFFFQPLGASIIPKNKTFHTREKFRPYYELIIDFFVFLSGD